jgi:Fe-S oxidoreductase
MEKPLKLFIHSLKKNLTIEHFSAMEACLSCRQCGSACAWYLTTQREELHPLYKKDFIQQVYKRYLTLEGRLLGWLRFIPTPKLADLQQHMASFWHCTVCGRCTLACPLGLSNRRITRLARAAYVDSGLAWENTTLRGIRDNMESTRHSFGLKPEQILLRAAFFLLHHGVDVPLGVIGAEYMFLCAAAGLALMPEHTPKFFKLLNAAGVDYTLSPRVFDPGTDIDHIVGHRELARKMLIALEEEAERLQVQKIIISECACDVHTFYVEINRILGRPFKFPLIFLDALLLDLIRSGRLPVDKIHRSVTFHDPCYITRLTGFADLERALLQEVAEPFIEMTPNREYNYCCNGGVGPLRLKENTELRREISILKINQIRQSKAEWVITPCAICFVTLRDITAHYQLVAPGHRMVYAMFELVCQAAAAALTRRGELARIQLPARWREHDPEGQDNNTFRASLRQLLESPSFEELFQWLSQDSAITTYLQKHPDAGYVLAALKDKKLPAQKGVPIR